jgi:hypothetical protein
VKDVPKLLVPPAVAVPPLRPGAPTIAEMDWPAVTLKVPEE